MLRLDPSRVDARLNLGVVYGTRGFHEMAIEEFRRVLKAKPENSQAHFNLGVALREMGLKSEALGEFRRALSAEPSHPKAQRAIQMLPGAAGTGDAND